MTEKVLFVDDSVEILSALQRALRRQFDAETAESGPEALELIDTKGPFAVIITDKNMPGMDGITFLHAAKEKAPNAVCLMMTGQAEDETIRSAIEEGYISSILAKPCGRKELQAAVQTAMDTYRATAL